MHPKMIDIEDRLRLLLDRLDNFLEDAYGSIYPLHPNRLARGKASSPSYDGLFTVHAKFTLGYGTAEGRGYVVAISLSTLQHVDETVRDEIIEDAVGFLEEHIPEFFPERELHVKKDGDVYKISGDFSLGDA